MEPEGFEPSTSPQRTERSTAELRSHAHHPPTARAEARSRTGDLSLTRRALFQLSYNGVGITMTRFEREWRGSNPRPSRWRRDALVRLSYIPGNDGEGETGIEPVASCLEGRRSTTELLPHDGRMTIGRDLPPGIEPGQCRSCNPMPSHLATGGGGAVAREGFEPPTRGSSTRRSTRLSYRAMEMERGRGGTRTHAHLINSQALYPLSYPPGWTTNRSAGWRI